MPRTLEGRLRYYGCQISAERFRELLADMFHKMFPNWNDEDLVHNPVEAIRYCDAIREVPGCEQLKDDSVILRALSAMRKSSLSTSKRQGGKLSRIS